VKKIVLLDPAIAAIAKHRNMAKRILDNLDVYAGNPAAVGNQVKKLSGTKTMRLRVGDFRVIFEETETEVIVSDIRPRGSIYK
jgi:mRNA interferase RelE/StbE